MTTGEAVVLTEFASSPKASFSLSIFSSKKNQQETSEVLHVPTKCDEFIVRDNAAAAAAAAANDNNNNNSTSERQKSLVRMIVPGSLALFGSATDPETDEGNASWFRLRKSNNMQLRGGTQGMENNNEDEDEQQQQQHTSTPTIVLSPTPSDFDAEDSGMPPPEYHQTRSWSADQAQATMLKIFQLRKSTKNHLNQRDFWISDKNARFCYECGEGFSMFLRKHHCRVCGQIFCYKCCEPSDILREKYGGDRVRICHYCIDIIKHASSIQTPIRKISSISNTTATATATTTTTTLGEDEIQGLTNSTKEAEYLGVADDIMPIIESNNSCSSISISISISSGIMDESGLLLMRRVASDPDLFDNLMMNQAKQSGLEELQLHRSSLEQVAQQHLRTLVLQLLQEDDLNPEWAETIYRLALRTVNNVSPNVKAGDKMDIRHYVKVKKAPGDAISGQYIDGLVFHKKLTHRKMKDRIKNPNILLVRFPLEHQRVDNKVSTFDVLLEQEREHLKLLIARLLDMKPRPDIILCEKTVAGIAKELVLEQGVSLMINVKATVMDTLARITHTKSVISLDECKRDHQLGTCKEFSVRKMTGAWGNKNLVIFTGCDQTRGCSIILRGPSKEELVKIKKLMKFAVYAAYNLKLESEFFFGACGTYLAPGPLQDRSDEGMQSPARVPVTTESRIIDTLMSVSPRVNIPIPDDPLRTSADAHLSQRDRDRHATIKDNYYKTDDQEEEEQDEDENEDGSESSSSNISNEERKSPRYYTMERGNFRCNNSSKIIEQHRVLFSPYNHQNIVILFTRVYSDGTSKEVAKAKIIPIPFYSELDLPLGLFLEGKCFHPDYVKDNLNLTRNYVHGSGRITVTVEQFLGDTPEIIMWSYNKKYPNRMTPAIRLSDNAWKYSFGKFLEVSIYNRDLTCRISSCVGDESEHLSLHHDFVRCFAYRNLVAKFEYHPITVYDVTVSSHFLEYDVEKLKQLREKQIQHLHQAMRQAFNQVTTILRDIQSALTNSLAAPATLATSTLAPVSSNLEPIKKRKIQEIADALVSVEKDAESYRAKIDMLKENHSIFEYNILTKNLSSVMLCWNSMIGELYMSTLNMINDASPYQRVRLKNNNNNFASFMDYIAAALQKADIASESTLPTDEEGDAQLSVTSPEEEEEDGSKSPKASEPPNPIIVEEIKLDGEAIEAAGNNGSEHTSADDSDDEFEENDTSSSTTITTTTTTMTTMKTVSTNTTDNTNTSSSNTTGVAPIASPRTLELPAPGTTATIYHNYVDVKLSLSAAAAAAAATEEIPTTTSNAISASPSPSNGSGTEAAAASTLMDRLPGKTPRKRNNNPPEIEVPALAIPCEIFDPKAHMFFTSSNMPMMVYEDEPSTIIAYTLCSPLYTDQILKQCVPNDKDCDQEAFIESLMRSKEKNHFKYKFSDATGGTKVQFSCTVYFPKQFTAFRKHYGGGSDNEFIRSLSRCKAWKPTGGKSQSIFVKTYDDRFILKGIQRTELLHFCECASAYFDYMSKVFFHQCATSLCKILGVYTVRCNSGKPLHLLVMENMFYNRNISRSFDLKGSTRNRYQKNLEDTLMDENLLEMIYAGSSLYTHEVSKRLLTTSIRNDTNFLSQLNIMDYSLLVGVDDTRKEYVVGIIDYMRVYSWDKQFETWAKTAGLAGGFDQRGKAPTVIPPVDYRDRFLDHMDLYFLLSPDKFYLIRNAEIKALISKNNAAAILNSRRRRRRDYADSNNNNNNNNNSGDIPRRNNKHKGTSGNDGGDGDDGDDGDDGGDRRR